MKQLRHLQDHGVNLRHLQEQGVNLGHLHEIAHGHHRGRAKTRPWQDSDVSRVNMFLFLCVIWNVGEQEPAEGRGKMEGIIIIITIFIIITIIITIFIITISIIIIFIIAIF